MLAREITPDRFPCNRIPGENCFHCPFDDCISPTSSTPVSKNEKEMLKCATVKPSTKSHIMDVGLTQKQKEHIAKLSKRSYLSRLKTYKRSKVWIERELKKYNMSSYKPNDSISSTLYISQADMSYSQYYS